MIKPRQLKTTTEIKRRAILIGNDRWGGKYLPGVSKDINAMNSFILSPEGGAWDPEEIIKISNPLRKIDLINFLAEEKNHGTAYFFIYFAGHGEMKKLGNPLFVLPGEEEISYKEIKEMLAEFPTLMITDSCQCMPEYGEGGRLMESRKYFSASVEEDRQFARNRFDEYLRTLPPMFTYASAVSWNQEAGEDDEGGYYTQNLLNSCREIEKDERIKHGEVIGICYPHSMARERVIILTDGKQRPTISGYTRSHQPPFLIKL